MSKPKKPVPGRSGTGRSIVGRRFSPGSNPPDITLLPFNNLTLVHVGKADKGVYEFTSEDVCNEIVKQIDPDKRSFNMAPELEFKPASIRIWNMTGKTASLVVFDHLNQESTNATLCSTMDVAASTSYASVGYEYPTAHKSTTLRKGKRKMFTVVVGASNEAMIYFSLHWKIVGIPAVISSVDLILQMRNQVSVIKSEMNKQTKRLGEINEVVKDIKKNQPGLLSKVVSGVTEVAAYVAPVAADETLDALRRLQESIDILSIYADAPEVVKAENDCD